VPVHLQIRVTYGLPAIRPGRYTQTTSASLLRLETHDTIFGESLPGFFSNCARGYFGSTVGRDEAVIRDYIRTQEQEDKRIDQLDMWR
jgi:hypothetical protein